MVPLVVKVGFSPSVASNGPTAHTAPGRSASAPILRPSQKSVHLNPENLWVGTPNVRASTRTPALNGMPDADIVLEEL